MAEVSKSCKFDLILLDCCNSKTSSSCIYSCIYLSIYLWFDKQIFELFYVVETDKQTNLNAIPASSSKTP